MSPAVIFGWKDALCLAHQQCCQPDRRAHSRYAE